MVNLGYCDERMRNKEKRHEWYLKNREKIILKNKENRLRKLKQYKQSDRKYYISHKDIINKRTGKWQIKKIQELRPQLLNLFGNKCQKCGFSDIRALQFDHINGGGRKEGKFFSLKSHGRIAWYRYYLSNSEVAKQKLQLLCANCNWIKRIEKKEVWSRYHE